MEQIAKVVHPQDEPKLKRVRMSEDAKAKAYESMRPGVPISEAQKAERFDRMRIRADNGMSNRRRRATVGTMTVPRVPWHEDNDE